MGLIVHPASEDDIRALIWNDHQGYNPVRSRDKDETFAMTGRPWEEVLHGADLENTFVVGEETWPEGFEPLVIFGFAGPLPKLDEPTYLAWLMGTDAGQRRAKAIHKLCRKALSEQPGTVVAYTIYDDLDKWHEAIGFVRTPLHFDKYKGFEVFKYIRRLG